MYIFISHSSKDATVADEICNILESNDNTCFLAPRDIRSGYEYAEEIVNGIDKSDVMLLYYLRRLISHPTYLEKLRER